MESRYPVVFLPGGVLPAEPAYAALLQALGERVDGVAKDLEVYATEWPPADYDLGKEAAGDPARSRCTSIRTVPSRGLFGGRRVLWRRFQALETLPPDEFMAGFVRLQLTPGVEPPPPPEGPPPPWMAKRPAGIRAFLDAFDNLDLDLEALRAFDRPVYFAIGGRSNPDYYARMAARLAEVFPDFTIETFPERHHFDPPHRIEPEHVADSLWLSGGAPFRSRPDTQLVPSWKEGFTRSSGRSTNRRPNSGTSAHRSPSDRPLRWR